MSLICNPLYILYVPDVRQWQQLGKFEIQTHQAGAQSGQTHRAGAQSGQPGKHFPNLVKIVDPFLGYLANLVNWFIDWLRGTTPKEINDLMHNAPRIRVLSKCHNLLTEYLHSF